MESSFFEKFYLSESSDPISMKWNFKMIDAVLIHRQTDLRLQHFCDGFGDG